MRKRLKKVVLCNARWNGESTIPPDLFSKYFYPDLSNKGTLIESPKFLTVSKFLSLVVEPTISNFFRKDYVPLVLYSSDDLVIENQCIAFYENEYSREHDDSDCAFMYCLVKFYDVCK